MKKKKKEGGRSSYDYILLAEAAAKAFDRERNMRAINAQLTIWRADASGRVVQKKNISDHAIASMDTDF